MAVLLIWLLSALIGWNFGARRHTRRGAEGLLLGLFLGPVGLVVLAALGPSRAARREQIDELVDAASRARDPGTRSDADRAHRDRLAGAR